MKKIMKIFGLFAVVFLIITTVGPVASANINPVTMANIIIKIANTPGPSCFPVIEYDDDDDVITPHHEGHGNPSDEWLSIDDFEHLK